MQQNLRKVWREIMDERVARLRSSQDARQLAENALRLGRLDVSAQALERAGELQAQEEGFSTPAQIAIARALYAYEEEQSRLKNRTFRANRTRQMLSRHGALQAAERMVLKRQPSTGFEVLEEADLQDLSFESIIDRFPGEFSTDAVEAARARLKGEASPPALRTNPRRSSHRRWRAGRRAPPSAARPAAGGCVAWGGPPPPVGVGWGGGRPPPPPPTPMRRASRIR